MIVCSFFLQKFNAIFAKIIKEFLTCQHGQIFTWTRKVQGQAAPARTGPNANHQTNLGAPKKLPLPPFISTKSHELLNYAHALEDVVGHKTKWPHSNLVLQVQAL